MIELPNLASVWLTMAHVVIVAKYNIYTAASSPQMVSCRQGHMARVMPDLGDTQIPSLIIGVCGAFVGWCAQMTPAGSSIAGSWITEH